MKYLLAFLLVSTTALASNRNFDLIDDIRSMEILDDSYYVTFQQDNREFAVSKNHSVIPCLENAQKSGMKVALKLDKQGLNIKECRLYSTPGPAR